MRILTAALFVALTATTTWALDLSSNELSRIQEAATVLKEIHGIPDKDIWQRAVEQDGRTRMGT